MKKNNAFTLVELLVVIAVIGILTAVIVISTNSAKGKARDAIRLSDMSSIQSSLDLYYDANAKYPDQKATPDLATNCITNCTISRADTATDGNPGKYISDMDGYFPSGLPNDPINKTSGSRTFFYTYSVSTASVSWTPSPCDTTRYTRRIFLGVRNFETIPVGNIHPQSKLQVAPTECWSSAFDQNWFNNLTGVQKQWGYTALEAK